MGLFFNWKTEVCRWSLVIRSDVGKKRRRGRKMGFEGARFMFFLPEGSVLVVLPCHHPALIISPPSVRVPWWRSLSPHPVSSSTLTGLDGVE